MNRRAYPPNGTAGLPRNTRSGFTLLEMVIVLFIIALVASLSLPAIQSALTEQAVRSDAHQIALIVKTAMIQSAEQHRAYVIDLTPTSVALHPAGEVAAEADDSAATDDDESTSSSAKVDVKITNQLAPPNKLLTPDVEKVNVWVDVPPTSWTFLPGELCPATRIRLSHGDSWLEMSFDALTGNVELEASYFP